MENNEQYFEEGMTVWDLIFGEGKVVSSDYANRQYYPFAVEFEEYGTKTYTPDGRLINGGPITLYQIKPIITPNVPIVKFEKGEMVWVKEKNQTKWNVRFFEKIHRGRHYCFNGQNKDGISSSWDEIRKFKDNPLI